MSEFSKGYIRILAKVLNIDTKTFVDQLVMDHLVTTSIELDQKSIKWGLTPEEYHLGTILDEFEDIITEAHQPEPQRLTLIPENDTSDSEKIIDFPTKGNC